MQQAGLIEHHMRKATDAQKKNPCSIGKVRNEDIPQFEKFTLVSFAGAFFVWAIGTAFSFLAFIAEFRRRIHR